ncbi:hypothetical protein [Sphingomonas koreensis]
MADDATDMLRDLFEQSLQYRGHDPNDPPAIEMSGDFGETLRFVRRTVMTPLVAPGRYTESKKSVSIALAHLNVEAANPETDDDETYSLLRQTMTLENAALLTASLVTDLKLICGSLARMEPAEMEQARLAIVRRMTAHIAHEALTTLFILNHMLGEEPISPAAAEKDPPLRSRPRVKPRTRVKIHKPK